MSVLLVLYRRAAAGLVAACFLVAPLGSATPAGADYIADFALQAYQDKEAEYDFDWYLTTTNGAYLGWGEGRILMSTVALYEATADPARLQRIRDHTAYVMSIRADRRDPPVVDELRGRVVPAWPTDYYEVNGEYPMYAYEVHAGMLCNPIARTAYLINKNPTLRATYGSEADSWIDDTMEMLAAFEDDWNEGPAPGEGHYKDFFLDGDISPYNQQNAVGRLYVNLYLATGQERFRERAEKLANFFKNDLRLETSGSYVPRYDWSYATWKGGSENISYGGMNADFAFQCYRAGIVFDSTDMQRFINTFKACSRGTDGFTKYVNGSGDAYFEYSYTAGNWLHLAYLDPTVRTMFFDDWFEHNLDLEANPQANYAAWSPGAGYLVETEQPFTFNSPAPQPSRQRTRLGFETDEPFFQSTEFGGTFDYGHDTSAGSIQHVGGDTRQGESMLEVTVYDDPGQSIPWRADVPAGTDGQGNPLALDRAGWVGLWLRTDTPALGARLAVEDIDGIEISNQRTLTADGQWHLYQWDLDDADQWYSYSGSGALEGLMVDLLSVLIYGPNNVDTVVYVDNLKTNVSGPITRPIPGDANEDGVVDEADAKALASNWGEDNATWPMGDLNEDGIIDVADAAVLAANWGTGTSEANSAVPEPSALTMLLAVVLFGIRSTRCMIRGGRLRGVAAASAYDAC